MIWCGKCIYCIECLSQDQYDIIQWSYNDKLDLGVSIAAIKLLEKLGIAFKIPAILAELHPHSLSISDVFPHIDSPSFLSEKSQYLVDQLDLSELP